MYRSLSRSNIQQLKYKLGKIKRLIPKNPSKFRVPVVKLSTETIAEDSLKNGLHHSYVDKNKFVKQNVRFENIANPLDQYVNQEFHHFLHFSINIVTTNILKSIQKMILLKNYVHYEIMKTLYFYQRNSNCDFR